MFLPRYCIRTLMIAVALVSAGLGVCTRPDPPKAVRATSNVPQVALRQEKRLAGVIWGMSLEEARERAQYEGRPILVYFDNVNDANGRSMEVRVFPRDNVMPLLSQFVTVELETFFVSICSLSRNQRRILGEENLDVQLKLTGEQCDPSFVVLDEHADVIATLIGRHDAAEFSAFLTRALAAPHHRGGPGPARHRPGPRESSQKIN